MGVFQPVFDVLSNLAGGAWKFIAGLLVLIAVTGGLFYVLQGTAGATMGGEHMTQRSILGAISIIVLVVIAFLVLPQMGNLLQGMIPEAPFAAGGVSATLTPLVTP